MDAFDALRAIGALILVIGLMLGFAWAGRRYGGQLGMRPARESDLRIVEWKTLDVRRKLAVVRWGDEEHLLCLGPAGDCVVARREAPAPTPDPAANDMGAAR